MHKPVASVEDGGTMTVTARSRAFNQSSSNPMADRTDDEAEHSEFLGNAMKPATATTRFAYSTGSRPLDGYTIKRGIGAGGFGEVYFAVSDAGKEVALKRIQRNLDVEIRGVTQCLNLKHANLIAIFDIRYDDEGQAWVVMEYVRGESLNDVIERNPSGMPLDEIIAWFQGIAAGVAYLHDHGIVHRDLKPGNIFADEGIVKIGDYGLSKFISCSRRSGQTESVGTFHYMAPEIGRGIYGKEIDVYALGVILYELLTGRVPFDGESSHEIIMKHLTALPDVSPLPAKIRPIVEKALFKDPAKRFRNVGEMLAAVHAALGIVATAPLRGVSSSALTGGSSPAGPRRAPLEPLGKTADDGIYLGPVRNIPMATIVPEPAASHDTGRHAFANEPIAAAVRDSWHRVQNWWNGPQLNRQGRVLLLVVFAILFLTNAGWFIPVGLVLGSTYMVYFGIRAIVLSLQSPATDVPQSVPTGSHPQPAFAHRHPLPNHPAAAEPAVTRPVSLPDVQPIVPARPTPSGGKRRRKLSEVSREHLARKTLGERLTELTGSMLMSSLVVAVVSFLTLIVSDTSIDGSVQTWTSFAWLSIMSLLGTWLLLIPAKLWEGSEGDHVRRRFVNLLLGLSLGVIGFGLTNFLGIRLIHSEWVDLPLAWRPPKEAFGANGTPLLPAFLAYFGGLFLGLRWWTQADPLRSSRFSLWATVVTLMVAGGWQIFWPFPQPWSLSVPVTMSIALQLSSTWLSERDRSQIRRSLEA